MFVKKLIVACVAALAWSGAALAQPTDLLVMRIKGMRCDESAHKVMKAVSPLEGVRDIRFNLERRTATVYYEAARLTPIPSVPLWAPGVSTPRLTALTT